MEKRRNTHAVQESTTMAQHLRKRPLYRNSSPFSFGDVWIKRTVGTPVAQTRAPYNQPLSWLDFNIQCIVRNIFRNAKGSTACVTYPQVLSVCIMAVKFEVSRNT